MTATITQPKSINPAKLETELVQLDEGVEQTLPAGTKLTINGVVLTQAQIDTTLQGWITTFKAVDQAKAAYQSAVAARLAITVAARTFAKTLKAVIKSQFGSNTAALATFGIAADKPVSTSATTKILAVGKRAQTRKVRGTKSKKAAAQITVVGQPPLSIASGGELQVGPPPINTAAGNTPAVTAAPGSTPAPAGTGSGSGTPGSSTPAGA